MNELDSVRGVAQQALPKPKEIVEQLQTGVEVTTEKAQENVERLQKVKAYLESIGCNVSAYIKDIKILNNKAKYAKVADALKDYLTTTKEKIDKLLKKYTNLELRQINTSWQTKDEIPLKIAEQLMKFSEVLKRAGITIDREKIKLIVPRQVHPDPILLVESPFGRFYYIIGAWDKEIDILHELLEE